MSSPRRAPPLGRDRVQGRGQDEAAPLPDPNHRTTTRRHAPPCSPSGGLPTPGGSRSPSASAVRAGRRCTWGPDCLCPGGTPSATRSAHPRRARRRPSRPGPARRRPGPGPARRRRRRVRAPSALRMTSTRYAPTRPPPSIRTAPTARASVVGTTRGA